MIEVLKVKEWLKNKKSGIPWFAIASPTRGHIFGILQKGDIENKNPCHPYKHETYLK